MSQTSQKILVIGGVAAGASFAARLRRLDERAEITIFERGPDVSFANCGLPYHIGGEIPDRASLAVQTPRSLKALLKLNVHTHSEAIQIDRSAKRVLVRDLIKNEEAWHAYDRLMLSPGASPFVPPIPGISHPAILTLRNLHDMDKIVESLKDAKRALVIGAGFIGLEMAEQLCHKGVKVDVVELQNQVLPQMDTKMTALIASELSEKGIGLHVSEEVVAFDHVGKTVTAKLASGKSLEADLVILSIGVRPENQLAKAAGLTLSARGQIVVNEWLQTSDPFIYAAGDAVETADRILGTRASVPLGGPANRQGRVAADHVVLKEKARPYPGSIGTAILRVFEVASGMTGFSEKRLQAEKIAYDTVTVNDYHHAAYFPNAQAITLKILWEKESGRLLGAQAMGHEGVDKRLDVLATAIAGRMTVEDLCHLELSYAPPFGSAKDIVNLAGFAATNLRDGLFEKTQDWPTDANVQIIDVRSTALSEKYPVAGALRMPFASLRENLDTLDKARPVMTLCAFGKMSYFAARLLAQHGFQVTSYAGGIKAQLDVTMPSRL